MLDDHSNVELDSASPAATVIIEAVAVGSYVDDVFFSISAHHYCSPSAEKIPSTVDIGVTCMATKLRSGAEEERVMRAAVECARDAAVQFGRRQREMMLDAGVARAEPGVRPTTCGAEVAVPA